MEHDGKKYKYHGCDSNEAVLKRQVAYNIGVEDTTRNPIVCDAFLKK